MATSDPQTSTRAVPRGQEANVRSQRRRWTRAVDRWDHHGVVGLEKIIAAVVAETAALHPDLAVDVGAGTGAIALPIAASCKRVIAVDVSQAMLDRLAERAAAQGVTNLETVAAPAEQLELEPGSVDVVVSNYALHHLLDADKRQFVHQAATWLRPGGSLVIGDMMLGRGADSEDRAIIAQKVTLMLKRGPGGWWRIAKNAYRMATRTSERPISMQAWTQLLEGAGFVEVTGRRVVNEAGLVIGRRPPAA
ncbi:MAG TPA: class I SAM-dependent methyltransferase [Acidimicrobiales bacterium]|nr:class I SAM-dependent methyltransferase [Acidimicrobiales bacterium]